MATPEQRIKRELSERGTCSFLDLKAAVKLSRGDIEEITARLASRGVVKIKKTWTISISFIPGLGRKRKQVPPSKPPRSRPGKSEPSRPWGNQRRPLPEYWTLIGGNS